jgi:hypothetical protein
MATRRALALALVVLAALFTGLATAGHTRILWRALVLSWDLPATQAQDELSVQASVQADPSGDIERAVIPGDDRGQRHACETVSGGSSARPTAGLTRSPPSA